MHHRSAILSQFRHDLGHSFGRQQKRSGRRWRKGNYTQNKVQSGSCYATLRYATLPAPFSCASGSTVVAHSMPGDTPSAAKTNIFTRYRCGMYLLSISAAGSQYEKNICGTPERHFGEFCLCVCVSEILLNDGWVLLFRALSTPSSWNTYHPQSWILITDGFRQHLGSRKSRRVLRTNGLAFPPEQDTATSHCW